MARQEQNDVFARTSFLYGGNAGFIEQLYARYETDPNSVDPEWQAFFAELGDEAPTDEAPEDTTFEEAAPAMAQAEPAPEPEASPAPSDDYAAPRPRRMRFSFPQSQTETA